MNDTDKQIILTEVVKNLFNTISADDILQEEGGVWFFEDKPLNEQIKLLIIGEAKHFDQSRLWQILKDDIKFQANKMMFEKSRNENDILAGKLYLYALDTIQTRLNSLKKESGYYNKSTRT